MFKTIGIQFAFLTIAISILFSQASAVTPGQDAADPGSFPERAIEMNRAGIQLAELAMQRAQDGLVKDFARTIVSHHMHVLQTLEGPQTTSSTNDPSATSSGLETNDQISDDNADGAPAQSADQTAGREKPDLITTTTITRSVLTLEHQQDLDRLSLLSDSQFDRRFIDLMVNEYRLTVRMFEQEAGILGTRQTELRHKAPPSPGDRAEMARNLLPALKQQLSRAEETRIHFKYR